MKGKVNKGGIRRKCAEKVALSGNNDGNVGNKVRYRP